MNSGLHSPTPTQTCTFPVYWLFSALPISHTILQTDMDITSLKPNTVQFTRIFNYHILSTCGRKVKVPLSFHIMHDLT